MIKNNISISDLVENLEKLKLLLKNFTYDKIKNVIFFNFDSFFCYLNTYCFDDDDKNLDKILTILEPYIPFEFDDKSLDFLVSSVIDNYDPEKFQNLLLKRAKIDFINSIKNATSESKWSKIVMKCKNIHDYKKRNDIFYI